MTLQTERVRTLEQVRAFVEGSEPVDFAGAGREGIYALVRRTLVRLDYHRLGKPDKGLVRRYLAKVTGLSRAQLTRLIGRHRRTGRIEARRGGPPAKPFERRYTRLDIRLLARLDAELGQMSGPATRAVLRRQWEVFGDARFERLARLSNGHLYNLRKSRTYRNVRRVVDRTRPTSVAIGVRRRPDPGGAPGHLRVDTVHQGTCRPCRRSRAASSRNLRIPSRPWATTVRRFKFLASPSAASALIVPGDRLRLPASLHDHSRGPCLWRTARHRATGAATGQGGAG